MVKRRPSPQQRRHQPPTPIRHLRFNISSLIAIGLALPVLGLLFCHVFPYCPSLSVSRPIATSPEPTSTTAAASMASVRRAAPLVFPAATRHTATVIFVHGLGDSGAGWADAVQMWQAKARLSEVKFILPNAPVIPITMNRGMPMPGWFDIRSLGGGSSENFDHDEDSTGILASKDYFHGLIQQEVASGIAPERIVLGGFSQGGAMSILSGLTAPVKIGGIVGLSSWLLLNQTFKDHVPAGNINKATPVFMGHGDRDPMVRYELAVATKDKLKNLEYDVTFKTYRGMEHSACIEELNEVEAFIEKVLPQGK